MNVDESLTRYKEKLEAFLDTYDSDELHVRAKAEIKQHVHRYYDLCFEAGKLFSAGERDSKIDDSIKAICQRCCKPFILCEQCYSKLVSRLF